MNSRLNNIDQETKNDIARNAYAIVPKQDNNLMEKTYQSFKLQQDGMSQEQADQF